MGLFDKIKEPVILKAESSSEKQLADMEQLLQEIGLPKIKRSLERDISAVKAGIAGENMILYELQNSHIPMFVLHDLYLEYEGLTAQIDFLVVTRSRNFVIECKNLYGDITIDNSGEFVRIVANKREGIYSPITQGRRHLELIKQIRKSEKKNLLLKTMFEKHFYENYRSVVVLANSKTILDTKHTPAEIKKQIIRTDQLTDYIRKVNAESGAVEFSEKDMGELANFFLNCHRECQTDYLKKYREAMQQTEEKSQAVKGEQSATDNVKSSPSVPMCPKCGAAMVKRRAARGENAGSEFWGCSKFPHCRGIIKIEDRQDNKF